MNYLDVIATTIQHLTAEPEMAETRRLYRLYAVLCLAKGETVTDADVHHAWAAWRMETVPDHWSLVPWEALSPGCQALNHPYTEAIRCVATQLRRLGSLEPRPVLDQLPAMFPPPTAEEIATAEAARLALGDQGAEA